MKKLYEESEVQAIADTIRYKLQIEDKMTMAEMPNHILNISRNEVLNANPFYSSFEPKAQWVRPTEYEDLNTLNLENDFEVVYLSLYKKDNCPWALGLYITALRGCQIEYGHIQNGEFVATYEVETIKNNTNYNKILPENEITLVAKITNLNALYPITYFGFSSIGKALLDSAVDNAYYYQPVVERVGKIPYVTSLANSSTSRGYGCINLERDALKFGSNTAVTSLAGAWRYCFNLQQLEVDGINTSHWKVTNLSNMFEQCKSLNELDLTFWDTSNWKVTTLANMFIDSNFRKINLSRWDTSGWTVTSLAGMFQNCYLLEEIDLTGWDTSNWAVTTLANTFSGCYNLKQIPFENWDTSNWAVITLSATFLNCHSLEELDLSKWNTTNWAVTTLSTTFQYCRNLKILKINEWDTSNWAVTSLGTTFGDCLNLTEIVLTNWDTSNWPVTTASMFSNMRKLVKVDLTGWNTSNWAISNTSTNAFISFQNLYSLTEVRLPNFDLSKCLKTGLLTNMFSGCMSLEKADLSNWILPNVANFTLATMFSTCYNLRELDLSSWDVSNCPVINTSSMFANCWSLKRLDISTWDTSNWAVTTVASMFSACYSLEELDLSRWNTSNWAVTTAASMFYNCWSLKNAPIENWDVSNWRITTLNGLFQNCYNLKSIDLSNWNTFNFALTDGRYFGDGCKVLEYLNVSSITQNSGSYAIASGNTANFTLKDFYPSVCSINQNYSSMNALSTESLLRILRALPRVSVARTLTLGTLRSKLTAADLAIATQKGWTVA